LHVLFSVIIMSFGAQESVMSLHSDV
jgi:hypothetical protein